MFISYKIIEQAFKDIPKLKEGAYQKYIQFKLLHSRTAVNKKLHMMNLIDTNKCQICQGEIETTKHAFLDCNCYTAVVPNRTMVKVKNKPHDKTVKYRQNIRETKQR